MQMQVREFLNHAGVDEPLYPGKKLLHKCQQPGEFKSHCVVVDWTQSDLLHIEVKPGLTGHDLKAGDLKKYPVSFQARTYVEIATAHENDNDEGDEDGETGRSGKGGGGGKKPHMKKKTMGAHFASMAEGKIPDLGTVTKVVVMGKEIAKDAYGRVLEKLAEQMRHAKIATTDLLAEAGKFVTKYTPPAFMKPRGDEDVKYKYDTMKNETMFVGRNSELKLNNP